MSGAICGDWVCPKCNDRIPMECIGFVGCKCGFIKGEFGNESAHNNKEAKAEEER